MRLLQTHSNITTDADDLKRKGHHSPTMTAADQHQRQHEHEQELPLALVIGGTGKWLLRLVGRWLRLCAFDRIT